MNVVLGVVDMGDHRHDAGDRPVVGDRRGEEHRDVGVAGEVAGAADAVLDARAHDVGGVDVAVDVGLDHAVHRQASKPTYHFRVVADLLRAKDDLVAVVGDVGAQIGDAVFTQ